MRYESTRGRAPTVDFEGAILKGLAPDGGLYVPQSWPHISEAIIESFKDEPYEEVVFQVVRLFAGDTIPAADLRNIVADAYKGFKHPDCAPLSQLGDNRWQLEVYYGPTAAFKDYALQLLTRLQNYFVKKRGTKITILTATSGDTGAAAIEACRGLDAVDIFVLHPNNGVSPLHRRLMTTVLEPNVRNVAVNGDFDDCQALVKTTLSDEDFSRGNSLTTLNSINFGRIVGQIAYYFSSAANLGSPKVAPIYSVPTGNFGDVYSGYAAAKMGLPISRLIVGTNKNDILPRFFHGNGEYERRGVMPTVSTKCMDIQAPSNFERLLYDLYHRDAEQIRQKMTQFAEDGKFSVSVDVLARARAIFASAAVTEVETDDTIRMIYKDFGCIVDPHTAVGIRAAEKCCPTASAPIVYVATSHPAKSKGAIADALNDVPADTLTRLLDAPARLNEIDEDLPNPLPEDFSVLGTDIVELKNYIRSQLRIMRPASSVAAE